MVRKDVEVLLVEKQQRTQEKVQIVLGHPWSQELQEPLDLAYGSQRQAVPMRLSLHPVGPVARSGHRLARARFSSWRS